MYVLLSFQVWTGEGRSGTDRLATNQISPIRAMPDSGRNSRPTSLTRVRTNASCSHVMNRERPRILFRVARVEHCAVAESHGLQVGDLRRDVDLFHRLHIDIRPEHALRDGLVVRHLFDHAPPAELTEPPEAVRTVRVIAVPLREDHVVRVLLLPSVTVLVPPEQSLQ